MKTVELVYISGPVAPTAKQRKTHPTAFHLTLVGAETAFERFDTEANVANLTDIALRVAASGYVPVFPPLPDDCRFLGLHTPQWWQKARMAVLRRCDAIALVDDWAESDESCREVIDAFGRMTPLWRDGKLMHLRLRDECDKATDALRSRGEAP